MKKNFLKIAALLIAAMLLVVSCSQEVKAPENNGLVEAKLNVAYGRDLDVTGDTKQDGVTLTYKMYPNWKIDGAEKVIYGGTKKADGGYEFRDLDENGSLGYVTPGLWTIEVEAKGHDVTNSVSVASKTIFTGKADVYFNDTTKTAIVYLAPVSEKNNDITFSFLMQDLSESMSDDYKLTYSIYNEINNKQAIRSGNLVGSVENEPENVKRYKEESTIEALPGGFYRVNVSIYRKVTTDTLVGGTTKGFLVSGDASVTIGGNIEPSDYEKVSIDAYYVNVKTKFKTDGGYGVVNNGTNGGATVKMAIVDETKHNSTIEGSYTKTYLWTAVSDGKTITKDTNLSDVEFDFNSPGRKNISCTTVYSITGKSTGENQDTTYYFADTISTQIYVSPEGFVEKTDTSSTNQ